MRVYLIGNEKFPSVTTILDIISKPGLLYYYGKYGTQKAEAMSNVARIMGNRLHKYINRDFQGKAKAFYDLLERKGKLKNNKSGKRLRDMINQYLTFKSTYNFTPIKSEETVYSKKYGYAGTVDSVGQISYQGKKLTMMFDWKSSGKVYNEYLLQIVAYLFAYKEMKPKTHFDGICCVSFNKELLDREPAIKIVTDAKQIEDLMDIFLHVLKIYEWRERRGGK